ncbi:HDIG domain-containing protein [bacterium]|jgi:poly(A) polymerase|nr:HDIG domain-containing protein [Acidimicrobiaceae bacterium]MCH9804360.1 HDIG domain-containing protein [bacterium]MDB2392080.1 HDIG domain-containing protein [Acidimicrobiaceae bacterium]
MEAAIARDLLSTALLDDDCLNALWALVDSGQAEQIIPELPALALEQDPIHKHKDVLAHTIAVTAKTRADLVLRLAALFHDIGKPLTRKIDEHGVTFRHHEAVGAKMAKKRLRHLEYPDDVVRDVAELVRLSGRFKGYADGWSDSAVRRYARDAGHLLGLLNELVRSDCTTRNQRKRLELHHHVDAIEERILELAAADRRKAERPLLDGQAVMDRFDVGPGPMVGKALKYLLELKRTEPDLDIEATESRLDTWWQSNS